MGWKCFGASVHSADGQYLAQTLGAAAYPFLCLVTVRPQRQGGAIRQQQPYALEVHLRLQGRSLAAQSPSDLLGHLRSVVRQRAAALQESETARLRREEEAALRREQDREFQEALEADRAREAERRAEREEAERAEREREERERLEQEEREEALAIARSLVGDEPPANGPGGSDAVTRIRLTLPNGRRIDRRFHADDTVGTVRAFLVVHFHDAGVDIANFALSTSFPRRAYDDPELTLREGGLVPQAVLMVQDLDS